MKLLPVSVLFAALFGATVAGAQVQVLDSWQAESNDVRRETTVLCIDGQKFVYFLADGTGTGVALIQVYEEQDGKKVPARCQMPRSVSRVPPLPDR